MKKWKMGAALLTLVFSLGMSPMVFAQAKSFKVLDMVQTEERVEARVAPEEQAEVGKIYEPGDTMLIVEGGNEQWYAVAYQGAAEPAAPAEAAAPVAPAAVPEVNRGVAIPQPLPEVETAEAQTPEDDVFGDILKIFSKRD